MHCLTAFDFGDFSRLGQVVVLRKGRRSAKKREKLRKSVTVNVHFADARGKRYLCPSFNHFSHNVSVP